MTETLIFVEIGFFALATAVACVVWWILKSWENDLIHARDFLKEIQRGGPDEEIIDLVRAEDWTPKSFIQLRKETRP